MLGLDTPATLHPLARSTSAPADRRLGQGTGAAAPADATAALPTVLALAALWHEVRRRPLWAPPNFFRYLKLRRRMQLALLDPSSVRMVAPRGKVNDCGACTDICCIGRHATVLLRLRDIAMLVDLGRTDLIVAEKPTFSEAELLARPALRRQVGSVAWRAFPVLAQNRFHACMALSANGRCTLFPHWPLSCARFPYSLQLDEREVFYSRRCDSFYLRCDGKADGRLAAMSIAAVAAYNERIKDAVLLTYAPQRLEALGLTDFLRPPDANA